MTEQETLHYVNATALAINLPLDAAQAQRVAEHLQRTFTIVAALKALPMLPEHEPAEIYRPAPWPTSSETKTATSEDGS
jgi:hypothetical protein